MTVASESEIAHFSHCTLVTGNNSSLHLVTGDNSSTPKKTL